MITERIRVFKSHTDDYTHAFETFLHHTNQKTKAKERLKQIVAALPSRKLFIDAGAGNGQVTAWLTGDFERTIASEPNESLRKELKAVCPKVKILDGSIMETNLSERGDFVLASHVMYYIDSGHWMENLERLASWLSPEGTLTVIIQNHETDCMKMLRHFFKRSFDLKQLAEEFGKKNGSKYKVTMETVPAHILAPRFEPAYAIAEFMMNLLPITDAPAKKDLEKYVNLNFSDGNGGFRFSCDQDFLLVKHL